MNFDLSEEQKMLAEQARGLMEEHSSPGRLRELIDSDAAWDEPLWRAIAEMGLLGAAIPEALGGVGLTELDLGVIGEALGRVNASTPFFSSIVCAADAIALFGNDSQREKWLPRMASGELVACFAYSEGRSGWRPAASVTELADGRLNGRKSPVADGGIAQIAVVTCDSDGDPALAIVELEQKGVARERLESFDQLRQFHELKFNGAKAELLPGVRSESDIDRLFDRISVQAAFDAVGAADRCVHMARDYAMDRQVFGRSLASYQAIKHTLADVLTWTEMARSNAYYAAWAAGEAPEELPAAASASRLTALKAYEAAARENLQVHGGIGYTFEANCHFYYRRERSMAVALGPVQYWADRLLAHARTGEVA